MSNRKKHLVVAGDGVEAWMAASALARALEPGHYTISVIPTGNGTGNESPFGLADSTLPLAHGKDQALLPDENRLVAGAGGTFTFGIALSGWSGPRVTYFHSFGSTGAEYGPVSFHQVVLRLREEGVAMRFANYSLAAMAAQAGRFQRPGGDPRSVLSTCRYGLHLDLKALAGMERTAAEQSGVTCLDGELAEVIHAEDGSIAALMTTGGERVEGDLYIDCSGVAARLIGETPGAVWEDWSDWLCCDRVLNAAVETPEAPLPYSHAEANTAGWVQYLPLQGQTVLNAVYQSDYCQEEQMLEHFRNFAGGAVDNLYSEPVRFGRCRRAWQTNCVALGTASALIDPVGVSNLQLLRTGINRLLTLLPGEPASVVEAAEYNRQTAAELSHARDFALLHYRLNGRGREPFWDGCRNMSVPASLGYKLQLYANLGRIAMYDFEPLEEQSWLNLFDEHGIQPRQLHPIAEGINADELKKHAERVRSVMLGALHKMPLHADYLSHVNAANTSN